MSLTGNYNCRSSEVYLIVPNTIILDENTVSNEIAMAIIHNVMLAKGFNIDGNEQLQNARKYKYIRVLE